MNFTRNSISNKFCASEKDLREALEQMGHRVAETTIRRIWRARGYSLGAKKKNIEGTSHPDRDAQFEHIHTTCQKFEQQGNPIISVDCKKKELLGQFKNNGAEWQAKGEATVTALSDSQTYNSTECLFRPVNWIDEDEEHRYDGGMCFVSSTVASSSRPTVRTRAI